MTVTTGGMAVNENVTMNTDIVVGGAQTWTVAAGKTLTVNANVNTHISPLTINCIGDTVVNGAIRDVRGDPVWNGLLTSSSGSVTKSGTGTLTFTGNNTYTGPTSIYSGTLKLDSGGSIAGDIIDVEAGTFDVSSLAYYSLNAGQILKGNGTVLGSMTVLGTVQPGESPGMLNTGNIIFGAGSVLDIELAGTTPGTLYDVLNSSGAINLQNGSELRLSLLSGLTPNDGDTFDIMNFSSLLGRFSILDLPSLAGGESWDLDHLYQNGTLSVVPEPTALAMLLTVLAAIACRIAAERRQWK